MKLDRATAMVIAEALWEKRLLSDDIECSTNELTYRARVLCAADVILRAASPPPPRAGSEGEEWAGCGVRVDSRVGCVAVYFGEERNCLSGIESDPDCVHFQQGHWDDKSKEWTVPQKALARAQAIADRINAALDSRAARFAGVVREKEAEIAHLKELIDRERANHEEYREAHR